MNKEKIYKTQEEFISDLKNNSLDCKDTDLKFECLINLPDVSIKCRDILLNDKSYGADLIVKEIEAREVYLFYIEAEKIVADRVSAFRSKVDTIITSKENIIIKE